MQKEEYEALLKKIVSYGATEEQAKEILTIIIKEEQFVEFQDRAGKSKRAQHTKQHGTVDAQLKVSEDLPTDLTAGVFQAGKIYRSKIRYSNAAGGPNSDTTPGVQGMAVKLLDVAGENLSPGAKEQDFLMISSPNFFAKELSELYQALLAMADGPAATKQFFEAHPNAFKVQNQTTGYWLNPMTIQFYSAVPFRYGDKQCKFSLKPRQSDHLGPYPALPVPADSPANYLQIAMEKTLEEGSVEYDFMVQFYQDDQTTPIDDAQIVWKTPFQNIGTLTVFQQYFTAPGQLDQEQKLNWSPWKSLKAHEPLGSLNMSRRTVYSTLQDMRAFRNQLAPNAPGQNPLNLFLKIKNTPVRIPMPDNQHQFVTKGDTPEECIKNNYTMLRGLLSGGGTGLDAIKTIHFARNIFVDEAVYTADGSNTKYCKTVALITSYDEGFADYIVDFAQEIYQRFNLLLSFVQDTDTIQDEYGNINVTKNIQSFIQFIMDHHIPPVAYYSSYPDLSVVQILQNRLARDQTNIGQCPMHPQPQPPHHQDSSSHQNPKDDSHSFSLLKLIKWIFKI